MAVQFTGIGFFGYLMGKLNRVVRLLHRRDDIKAKRKEDL